MNEDLRRELNDDSKSLYLDLSTVQKILGMSRGTVYTMVKAGDIPGSVHFSGRWLVDKKKFRDALGLGNETTENNKTFSKEFIKNE
jgi:predicted DNA-binding transcriptional regulator AlpA